MSTTLLIVVICLFLFFWFLLEKMHKKQIAKLKTKAEINSQLDVIYRDLVLLKKLDKHFGKEHRKVLTKLVMTRDCPEEKCKKKKKVDLSRAEIVVGKKR